MLNAVDIVTSSMQLDELRLRLSAHNAANALTPGFKRQYEAVSVAGVHGGGATPAMQTLYDMRPAALMSTGAPLDLAIEGEGYFEVQRDGRSMLTRVGRFAADAEGRLVNEAGWALQGTGGDLMVTGPAPRIDASGTVFENERVVAQVRVMVLPEGVAPRAAGGALWEADTARPASSGEAGRVRQGYLERSNVNAAAEMVRVLETVRHFESGQRALLALDDMNDKLLRSLGSF